RRARSDAPYLRRLGLFGQHALTSAATLPSGFSPTFEIFASIPADSNVRRLPDPGCFGKRLVNGHCCPRGRGHSVFKGRARNFLGAVRTNPTLIALLLTRKCHI